MIELEIGKAIVAVENHAENCKGCYFINISDICQNLKCFSGEYRGRKDGKNVIYKLVDFNSHYIDGTMRGKQ